MVIRSTDNLVKNRFVEILKNALYFSYAYTNRKKIPRNFSPCSSSLIHKIVSNNLLSSNRIRFGHDTKLFFDSLKRKDRTMIKMIIITLYQISMSISKLGNIFGCIFHYTNNKHLIYLYTHICFI